MFVVNSVSGFEGFGGTPLPKLPLSAPPGIFCRINFGPGSFKGFG